MNDPKIPPQQNYGDSGSGTRADDAGPGVSSPGPNPHVKDDFSIGTMKPAPTEGTPTDEDQRDIDIAHQRLDEFNQNPQSGVKLDELKNELRPKKRKKPLAKKTNALKIAPLRKAGKKAGAKRASAKRTAPKNTKGIARVLAAIKKSVTSQRAARAQLPPKLPVKLKRAASAAKRQAGKKTALKSARGNKLRSSWVETQRKMWNSWSRRKQLAHVREHPTSSFPKRYGLKKA